MKKEKGITLITLTITIIILIILTFSITVNVGQLKDKKNKANFETDMKSLKEEIDQYYAKEKELPIINKYTNTSMLNEIKNINDNDNYYVIDIDKLEVKLNYGADYNIIKGKTREEEITDLLDVYIINEESHTIYYPSGIEYNEKIHYTLLGTYNMIKVEGYVNKPQLLEGMTPIKFEMPTDSTMGTKVKTTENDESWYQYGTTYETKKWANAETEDGSMWVWIPRFAYRINSSTQTTDVVFLIGTTDNYYDENGAIKTAKRQKRIDEEPMDTTIGYTVHPAFTDETSIDFVNGGWDKELRGIWVAKFEAGYASGNNDAPVVASKEIYHNPGNTVWVYAVETGGTEGPASERNWLDGIYNGTETTIKYPTFQGTTYTMNFINPNDAYNVARALTDSGNIYKLNSSNTDSHLMKNSEWGAVAYLTASKYGQYDKEMAINNISLNSGNRKRTVTAGKSGVDSVYAVTGCTSNTTNTEGNKTTIEKINGVSANKATIEGIYVWNQKTGQNASTTGTIYGIYDMIGGAWHITSAYIATNIDGIAEQELLKKCGESITYNGDKLRTISTKYTTVYPNNELGQTDENAASQKNFASNTKIYGDAIRETTALTAGTANTGWNVSSWNSKHSWFPGLRFPFFRRAGGFRNSQNTGVFAFFHYNGTSTGGDSFRPVLVAK